MFETWHINPPVTDWALYLQLLQGSETRWAGTNDTPQSLGINGNVVSKPDKVQRVHLIFNCERFRQKTWETKRLLIVNAMWWFENKNGLQPVVLPVVVCHQNVFKKSFKAFMTIISATFKVTQNFWGFRCLLMFAKATKWLCSVTHHQTGHVVKEKTVSFPFASDFFCTWSSLHCFVNFFVSEAEASNEAKNTGRDNTKSKRGEQHVLPKANPHANLWHDYAHNSLKSNKEKNL